MIHEVRVVLEKPENINQLNTHINHAINQMSTFIESHYIRDYALEKRKKYIDALKEIKKNKGIMSLRGSTFSVAVEETYGIEVENKLSPENIDYNINISETAYKRDLEECQQKIAEQKQKTLPNIVIVADIPEMRKYFDESHTVFSYLTELASEIPNLEHSANLSVKLMPDDLDINDKIPKLLSDSETDGLADLISYVRKNNITPTCDVGIREYVSDTDTSVEQIIKANDFIKKVADEVKSKNLSPFETVVYVHNFCSEFGYTNRGGDKRYGSRILKNIIASGNINCIGFSTLFKAIIDEIDNKNISVSFNHGICPYDNDYLYGSHGNVLVKLKDEKYGIDGEYVSDISLNNARERFGHNICCCLMPVEDLENIDDFEYFYSDTYPRKAFYDEDLKPTDFSATKTNIDKLIESHIEFIAAHNHPPIEFSKFEDALKAIALKMGMDEESAERYCDNILNRSIQAAADLFIPSAVNCFYSLAKELDIIITFDEDYESTDDLAETRRITGNNNRAKIDKYVGPTQD